MFTKVSSRKSLLVLPTVVLVRSMVRFSPFSWLAGTVVSSIIYLNPTSRMATRPLLGISTSLYPGTILPASTLPL